MILQTFFSEISPILVTLLVIIIIFLALKKIGVPGSSSVLFLIGLLMALIFMSSKRAVNYLISLIPFFTILISLTFIILLVLAFVAKDISTFSKPLAWIGFILAIVLCLAFAFNQFPTLNHMLPNSSDAHLTAGLEDFKDFIYSKDFKDSFIFIISIAIVCFFIVKK